MESKLKNPFERFPKEIWEMMLEQMEDSQDILSVLRGIPKLDVSIDTRKRYWYIGQILPCLYGFIDLDDVLNLRLVCKEWQRRVDHFLQNQPYYRAYSKHRNKDQHWAFFEQSNRINSFENCLLLVPAYQDEGVSQKLDEIMEHPPTRNPFVFREIAVNMRGMNFALEELRSSKIISGLEQFGTHVWYLNVRTEISGLSSLQINVLIKLLQLMPNLKGLKFELLLEDLDPACPQDTSVEDTKLLKKNLPELPFLEALEIWGIKYASFEALKVLVKRYGPQIRRLNMPMYLWKVDEVKNLFLQVAELQLNVCAGNYNPNISESEADLRGLATLRNLLATFTSPHIVKLRLRLFIGRDGILCMSVEEDILKWLKRFPNIKYFEIESDSSQPPPYSQKQLLIINENRTSDPIKDSIPTLVTLKLPEGYSLSYNFLLCFPSLRQLELTPFFSSTVIDFSMPHPVKLREEIQTGKLYESNIWEVLPKLREVSMFSRLTGDQYEFQRDTFEKLKKAGRIPTEPQLHPFRRDVLIYMKYFPYRDPRIILYCLGNRYPYGFETDSDESGEESDQDWETIDDSEMESNDEEDLNDPETDGQEDNFDLSDTEMNSAKDDDENEADSSQDFNCDGNGGAENDE